MLVMHSRHMHALHLTWPPTPLDTVFQTTSVNAVSQALNSISEYFQLLR